MHDILHNGAISLHHGDCLDVMREIPDGSVDAIICDLPYGKTSCAWDSVIPFEPMWIQLKRIIKPRGAIVLFGSQPFTSALIMSNVKWFKYQWIWRKNFSFGFANAYRQPLRDHEDVVIFYKKQCTYNPVKQISKSEQAIQQARRGAVVKRQPKTNIHNFGTKPTQTPFNEMVFPTTVQEFDCVPRQHLIHDTQKPVALLEYLIRTYTNEGETVLDFTFGSCTAGVAALNTDRRFIGIERDDTYYALGVQRVQTAIDNLPPMDV